MTIQWVYELGYWKNLENVDLPYNAEKWEKWKLEVRKVVKKGVWSGNNTVEIGQSWIPKGEFEPKKRMVRMGAALVFNGS